MTNLLPWLRLVARLISRRNQLPILAFHRVLKHKDPLRPDDIVENEFAEIIRALVEVFDIVPLCDAVDLMVKGRLRTNSIAITFDDGYLDNYTLALPILSQYNVSATFFIASGFMNGGWMWNDGVIEAITKTRKDAISIPEVSESELVLKSSGQKLAATKQIIDEIKYWDHGRRADFVIRLLDELAVKGPTHLMMCDEDLCRLVDSGMDIGGHTISHPILTSIDDHAAYREIYNNKEQIEKIIGKRIHLFAYPNGKPGTDYNAQHVDMVEKAGYTAAVTTHWAVATHRHHRFEFPRLSPWDYRPYRFISIILKDIGRLILNPWRPS